ncbi:kinase-like domain-containing protein [Zychaea mexicana]|uniref:kinase-like domain-containing protein n=1 Tax=Zychaea mexicana TaxID=64656 RepID=UPI0022FDBC8C|nr:kinase-like domain-containing protein [Zychaea mexicana]KAI9497127.1 kinase-like domain-containing protein [Zychaea mexicana]
MPDLESLVQQSSSQQQPHAHVGGGWQTSSVASTSTSSLHQGASGTSSVQSDCSSVLSHDNGQHLEIAAIESTFMVHDFDKRKQKWVERTRTVFNVIIEDKYQNRSLVRYVPDFVEFDKRIKTHYPKVRVPLPQLVEPHLHMYTQRRRRNSVTSLISRIIKFTSSGGKSNSEKIEMYLRRCALHPTIGRSSLFRDFLAAQRSEDQIVPNRAILEQIHLEQSKILCHRASSIVAAPAAMAVAAPFPSQPKVVSGPAAVTMMGTTTTTRSSSSSSQSSYVTHTSGSSMVVSSMDSCHGGNDVTSSNSNILGGISIHEPRTTSPAEIVIGGDISSTATYESLIDDGSDKPTKIAVRDFEILKVLGRGCIGKVFLVRRIHPPSKLLALKAIRKQWVITSRQIEHTKTERDILTKIAKIRHPFLIKLHYAFQDTNQLFLVFDFHVGGDLATQLKNDRMFTPKRCRLYAAEILLGLEELHRMGILYRDLKPENILLRADGHLVLTDFSLSKLLGSDDLERTNTFCGTPEYLAPEVILGEDYSYAVDFWSYGTILYEMMEGEPPFYLENTMAMYRRVLVAPLILPDDFDPCAADLISGLLQREPSARMGVDAIRNHPYFKSIDWDDVYHRRILPPYVPDLRSKDDCANFDQECLAESPRLSSSLVDNNGSTNRIQHTSGMTFQGYSYINDSQITEDTPSFTNDSRWMLTEEDGVSSFEDDDAPHHHYQQQQQQRRQRCHQQSSDMSFSNDSLKSPNDSTITDPNPSFTGGQQRNSRVFYYNDSEVVPYDITTESDEYMPTAGTSTAAAPSFYYGTGSALLSVDDRLDDEDGNDSDDVEFVDGYDTKTSSPAPRLNNERPPTSRLPGISLSRHYGARQINANF